MEICLKAGAVKSEVGEEVNLKGVELNEKEGVEVMNIKKEVELNKKEEEGYLHP